MPSIYHIWYYKTMLGQHRRKCQLFREQEPSLLVVLSVFPSPGSDRTRGFEVLTPNDYIVIIICSSEEFMKKGSHQLCSSLSCGTMICKDRRKTLNI